MNFAELLNNLNKAGYKNLHSETHHHLYGSNNWCMMVDDYDAGRLTLITSNSFLGADTPEEDDEYGLLRFLNESGGDDDILEPKILFIQVDGVFTHVSIDVQAPYTTHDGHEQGEEIVVLYDAM